MAGIAGITRSITTETDLLKPKAEENKKLSGELYGKGKVFQKSEKPIDPINTTAEAATEGGGESTAITR